jgi:hypothetical protein
MDKPKVVAPPPPPPPPSAKASSEPVVPKTFERISGHTTIRVWGPSGGMEIKKMRDAGHEIDIWV